MNTNPFTEKATGPRTGRTAAAMAWILAVVAALLGVWLFLTISSARIQQLELASLKDSLASTRAAFENATNEIHNAVEKAASLQARVTELEQEKEKVASAAGTLEREMRAALESKDVTISDLQGRLTLNILDNVMFDSGEAVLKPGGEAVMRKVAAFLTERPELKIHVIGHTDNIPIRADSRSRFASNWELSAARALAAVHFLSEQAGLDPRRVAALAYGEHHPVADNATAEGRAKNRRIEIAILPAEPTARRELVSGTAP